VLLLGGDKAGNWERWYRDNIPLAERLYIQYTAINANGIPTVTRVTTTCG